MPTLPAITDAELLTVQKPSQYLGGEIGSIEKNDADILLHLCLAFPDTYTVGMSHMGYQILYDLINREEQVWAERAYVPLQDMDALLRDKGVPLCSLESKRALNKFDVVGFSLQYELCITGVLSMLDLGLIPFLTKDRTEDHPIVIGGGPLAYHPEPFADFFDAFLIGDGEELVLEFARTLIETKKERLTKGQTLLKLSRVSGVYVPSFFEPEYAADGSFLSLKSLQPEGHATITHRLLPTLENAPYPKQPLIPNIKAVHDRLNVEVMRGCVRGCRFCQAGFLYRPQRERNPEEIMTIVKDSLSTSGYEELSLLSLSTADYCSIVPLINNLKSTFAKNDHLAISLPSTRVDALGVELLKEMQPLRRSGFTLAPEAGSQRLRDVINKNISDEQIIETCRAVFELGWSRLKLYFMIGLPTETDADIEGIVNLAAQIKKVSRGSITISVSTFVPKPHTPFQWAEQIPSAEVHRRQALLHDGLKQLRVGFKYHQAESTFLEGIFARGDRRLGAVILKAYALGCRFDGWEEEFRPELWRKAFEAEAISPDKYLKARRVEDALPWDHIKCDIPKEYFVAEWQRATAGQTTADCLTGPCSVCGICDHKAIKNVLFNEAKQPLNYAKHVVSPAPVTTRLRCCYTKCDKMRFTAHLELITVFFRAARRAAIPLAYSKGYNPKPKMAFGPPIQLGLESLCEYVDILLTETISGEDLVTRLNQELPEGLKLIAAEPLPLKTPSIQGSIKSHTYEISFTENLVPKDSVIAVKQACHTWQEKAVERIRKTGHSTVALKDYVKSLTVDDQKLCFTTIADPTAPTLKPTEVINAIMATDANTLHIKKIGVEFV
ncbi:TIGR03960 family B12-binding radical SAM protein [Oligoflexia bacterium]|nr:TIGR03960 family B12-binding radical SAM protein [Oligoflexia bacterium]